MTILLLMAAAFAAGAINSVAGGGSFLTFPALVFRGVSPVIANASNTVALVPGTVASILAYRGDVERLNEKHLKLWLLVSLLGGAAGAALLLVTSDKTFRQIAPWLLLFATLLFAFGNRVSLAMRGRLHGSGWLMVAPMFPIAVYGGYFGGGHFHCGEGSGMEADFDYDGAAIAGGYVGPRVARRLKQAAILSACYARHEHLASSQGLRLGWTLNKGWILLDAESYNGKAGQITHSAFTTAMRLDLSRSSRSENRRNAALKISNLKAAFEDLIQFRQKLPACRRLSDGRGPGSNRKHPPAHRCAVGR